MSDKLKDIAMRSGVAKLDAELTAIKHRRSGREWTDLEVYVSSPDFAARAAEVKEDALDALANPELIPDPFASTSPIRKRHVGVRQ